MIAPLVADISSTSSVRNSLSVERFTNELNEIRNQRRLYTKPSQSSYNQLNASTSTNGIGGVSPTKSTTSSFMFSHAKDGSIRNMNMNSFRDEWSLWTKRREPLSTIMTVKEIQDMKDLARYVYVH